MPKKDDIFVRVGMIRGERKRGSVKIKSEKKYSRKPKTSTKNKLKKLAKKSRFIIFHTQSRFPYNLFPDSITIYTNKINVVHRSMLSSQSFPILIEDIKTATDFNGIIYASLYIEIAGFEQNPPPIKWLTPDDASTARKYIIALLEANREGIDLEYLDKKECMKYLNKIGESLTNVSQ